MLGRALGPRGLISKAETCQSQRRMDPRRKSSLDEPRIVDSQRRASTAGAYSLVLGARLPVLILSVDGLVPRSWIWDPRLWALESHPGPRLCCVLGTCPGSWVPDIDRQHGAWRQAGMVEVTSPHTRYIATTLRLIPGPGSCHVPGAPSPTPAMYLRTPAGPRKARPGAWYRRTLARRDCTPAGRSDWPRDDSAAPKPGSWRQAPCAAKTPATGDVRPAA